MRYSIASLDTSRQVKLVDGYGDGTVWARIEDRQSRAITVCIDGRKGSPTRYRLFENARHPRGTDATLVELGADEEGIVVSLISQWLDSNDESKEMFTEVGIKMVQDALLHLGEPSSGLGESCVEIVLPRYLDKPIRSSIESHLAEALKSACVGRIAGGSGGNGKTDFFVTLTDLCVGISVVRSVLLAHEITQDAVIKQYEPVAIVHRLN